MSDHPIDSQHTSIAASGRSQLFGNPVSKTGAEIRSAPTHETGMITQSRSAGNVDERAQLMGMPGTDIDTLDLSHHLREIRPKSRRVNAAKLRKAVRAPFNPCSNRSKPGRCCR